MSHKHRNWFFTLNNYTEEDIKMLVHKFSLEKFYRFQKEVGKNGTKHLQGMVKMKEGHKLDYMKKINERAHWEVCKNVNAAANYCKKLDTYDGERFEGGELKKKKELPMVKDPLKGKELYPWQKDLISWLESDPDDRCIVWIWDEKGNVGKTSLLKHIILNEKKFGFAIMTGGRYKDACHIISNCLDKKKEPRIVFLNVSRDDYESVDYKAIENIKDGIFASTKYDSSMRVMNCPHLIIFSNKEPAIRRLSLDRWAIFKISDQSKEIIESKFLV